MTIWNLGSINADHVYSVPHIPAPGETLAASGLAIGLGGKGTNMSVAAARAGARVMHVGAVGADGLWTVERLRDYGVDTSHVAQVAVPTGHAIIYVDQRGENSIILFEGANHAIPLSVVQAALAQAKAGDLLLLQNETNLQADAANLAHDIGLRVAYAAAPFSAAAVQAVLPVTDFLVLNQIEADQLRAATGNGPADLPVSDVIVTLGAEGADWFDNRNGRQQHFEAHSVAPVDTTGAGDTFTGYVLAALDRGQPMVQAINLATRAAALMVTRPGAADVIPDLSEVNAFQS